MKKTIKEKSRMPLRKRICMRPPKYRKINKFILGMCHRMMRLSLRRIVRIRWKCELISKERKNKNYSHHHKNKHSQKNKQNTLRNHRYNSIIIRVNLDPAINRYRCLLIIPNNNSNSRHIIIINTQIIISIRNRWRNKSNHCNKNSSSSNKVKIGNR